MQPDSEGEAPAERSETAVQPGDLRLARFRLRDGSCRPRRLWNNAPWPNCRPVADEAGLRAWNTKYFGKQGEVTAALKDGRQGAAGRADGATARRPTAQGDADPGLRGRPGRRQKGARAGTQPGDRRARRDAARPARAARPAAPVARRRCGEIYAIFADLGFQIYRSREVEDDETNFELLNMPPHHPARDMWDTFHTTTPGVLLRTHTSPGQIHVMREQCPKPIRVILPGMCYRYEADHAAQRDQFHQVEGLAVGERHHDGRPEGHHHRASPAGMFGAERQVRIRSSYFPFTEPSIEVDIDWPKDDPQRATA